MARTDLGAISLIPRGAYSAATAYKKLDVVTYDGGSYMCIGESTGNLPTNATYWQQLAAKGDRGPAGADGLGAGDMTKSVYDTDNDGIVDNAEKLGGSLPSAFATASHTHATTDVTGLETRLTDLEDTVDDIETLLAEI